MNHVHGNHLFVNQSDPVQVGKRCAFVRAEMARRAINTLRGLVHLGDRLVKMKMDRQAMLVRELPETLESGFAHSIWRMRRPSELNTTCIHASKRSGIRRPFSPNHRAGRSDSKEQASSGRHYICFACRSPFERHISSRTVSGWEATVGQPAIH